jgi:hypothetical protein
MTVDEIYDMLLEQELGSRAVESPEAMSPVQVPTQMEEAPVGDPAEESAEQTRGLARYRNAAMVGAGGLACAAVGALLGGLGGYFTVSPADAHSIAASAQDAPLANAVNRAAGHTAASPVGGSAVGTATFAGLAGSLTQGISSVASLTSLPSPNLPVIGGLPSGAVPVGTGGNGPTGGGNPPGGGGTPGTTCGGTGLLAILGNLTCDLGNLGSLSSAGGATGLLGTLPGLDGVVSDVTGALGSLSALLPLQSLPTSGLSVPTTGTGGSIGSTTGGGLPLSSVDSVVSGVTSAVGALTGGSLPVLPTSPLPIGSTSTSAAPTTSAPSSTSGGTAVPTLGTPTLGTSGGSTTLNVPLPSTVTGSGTTTGISLGGISIGVTLGGSNSGATLTLP